MHANNGTDSTSSTRRRPPRGFRARAAADGDAKNANDDANAAIKAMDDNQLQTALTAAIDGEDYALAARIRDVLHQRGAASSSSEEDGEEGGATQAAAASATQQPNATNPDPDLLPLDWRALGVPEWLADRAERLGLRYPTLVQRRAGPVVAEGCDAVVSSVTGSGKTAAFLLPALARLPYPPDLIPDDLDGPCLLIVVPTFELGAQAALLTYRLLGGSISARRPGDAGNMFSYGGPRGVRVRGLLTREEVEAARRDPSGYLRGVHVVVATPDCALAAASEDGGGAAWRLQAAALEAAAAAAAGSGGSVGGLGHDTDDDEDDDEDAEEGGGDTTTNNNDDDRWRLPPSSPPPDAAAGGGKPSSSSGEVDSASAYQIATGRSTASGGARRRRGGAGSKSGSGTSSRSNAGGGGGPLGGLSQDAQMSPLLAALEAMKAARDGGVGPDGAAAAAAAARAARLREEGELDKAAAAAAAAGEGGGARGGGTAAVVGDTVARLQALRSKGHALLSTP